MKSEVSPVWSLGLLLALLVGLSCATEPEKEIQDDKVEEAIAPALGALSPEHLAVRDQSRYEPALVEAKLGEYTLNAKGSSHSAAAHQEAKGSCWVRFGAPHNPQPDERFVIKGHPKGLAFVDKDGELILRVAAPCPEQLEVQRKSIDSWAHKRFELDWLIVGIQESALAEDLEAHLLRAATDTFSRRSQDHPFYSFARHRLFWLANRGSVRPARPDEAQWSSSTLAHAMELYTGMGTLEESLQSQRGLRVYGPSEQSVDIESLAPVALAPHPWEEMKAELSGKMRIEKLAAWVPQDIIYIHSPNLTLPLELAGRLDDLLSPLVRAAEENPGVVHFARAYEQELLLDWRALAAQSEAGIGEMALLLGDSLLREGSDVGLLLEVTDPAKLTATLAELEKNYAAEGAAIEHSSYQIGSHEVELRRAPEFGIEQHRLFIDSAVFLANSRAAVSRLVAVVDGERPGLASSPDFQYMRTLYPYSAAADELFFFVGESLVARMVSPAFKIAQARRTLAKADLMAVNYSWLLYGWLEGHPPADLQTLVDSGYLDPRELAHSDGSPITMTQQGASSSWGVAAKLRPIAEIALDKVSIDEAQAYKSFRAHYENNWEAYIDPIALQLRRQNKELSLDGRMLPLSDKGKYRALLNLVGEAKTHGQLQGKGIQWTFALGEEAILRRELDNLCEHLIGKALTFEWVGDWVEIGAADYGRLFELLVIFQAIPSHDHIWPFTKDFATIAADSPIYLSFDLRDEEQFEQTLDALKSHLNVTMPRLLSWQQHETYNDVPIVAVVEKNMSTWALYYAKANGVLVISPSLSLVKFKIDQFMAAERAPHDAPAGQSILQLDLEAGGVISRSLLGLFEKHLSNSNRAALHAAEILVQSRVAQDPSSQDPALVLPPSHWSEAFYGYAIENAHSTKLSLSEEGLVQDPLYGSLFNPKLPAIPVLGSPLTEAIESLSAVSLSIEFEGEDDQRALHLRAQLKGR